MNIIKGAIFSLALLISYTIVPQQKVDTKKSEAKPAQKSSPAPTAMTPQMQEQMQQAFLMFIVNFAQVEFLAQNNDAVETFISQKGINQAVFAQLVKSFVAKNSETIKVQLTQLAEQILGHPLTAQEKAVHIEEFVAHVDEICTFFCGQYISLRIQINNRVEELKKEAMAQKPAATTAVPSATAVKRQ